MKQINENVIVFGSHDESDQTCGSRKEHDELSEALIAKVSAARHDHGGAEVKCGGWKRGRFFTLGDS